MRACSGHDPSFPLFCLTLSPVRAFIHMTPQLIRRRHIRLSTAIARFGTQLQADGKSEHTRSAYLRDLKSFRAWLRGSRDLLEITANTLARYLASEVFTSKAAISVNRTKTALRMFFKFLTDAGYLETNPARLIKNSRCEQKTPEHLTRSEAKSLLSAIPLNDGPVTKRDRVMFTLLLQTGIRLGSLVQLKVRQVRLGECTLKINGKGGAEQSVYLKSTLRRLLRSYIRSARLNSESPLFPSRNGVHLGRRQVQLHFHHWLQKADIKRNLTVHSLRHTFAMNLYRKTGDLRLVQTALEHKRITTTEIYARVDDRRLKRALEKL
jgi:integrase/recombinase XerD